MKCSNTTWKTWEKLKAYNGSTPLPTLNLPTNALYYNIKFLKLKHWDSDV